MIVGIDPGIGGGIAAITDRYDAWPMPRSISQISRHLHQLIADAPDYPHVFVEAVTFGAKLCRNLGRIEGILEPLPCEVVLVPPAVWQRQLGLLRSQIGNKEMSKTEKKNHHKAYSKLLFPSLKITHKVADALLIATYGKWLIDEEYRLLFKPYSGTPTPLLEPQ